MIRDVYPRIPNPIFFPLPDPGSKIKKIPDPGSASKNFRKNQYNLFRGSTNLQYNDQYGIRQQRQYGTGTFQGVYNFSLVFSSVMNTTKGNPEWSHT